MNDDRTTNADQAKTGPGTDDPLPAPANRESGDDGHPTYPREPMNAMDSRWERRAARAQARAERRAYRGSGGSWIAGGILILLGLVFLGQNLGMNIAPLNNWWALFILIPAVGSLTTAWNIYQANGRLTQAAWGSLIGGTVLTLITITLLFSLNWGLIFPLLLILAGVAALAGAFWH